MKGNPMRFLIAMILMTTAAHAKLQCADHDKVAFLLKTKFGETPQTIAVSSQGNMVETFATPDGKTWTIVVTQPSGMACLVSGGTDYRAVPAGDPT